MFCRALRVRSNTAIKGSDRRKLRTDVAAAFPNLSAEQLTEFIPNKEELNVIKMHSHKGEAITVYMNNRNPILFEIEKALYPTVYTLWVYPDLLPAFSTWPPVLQKLAGGAEMWSLCCNCRVHSRFAESSCDSEWEEKNIVGIHIKSMMLRKK